MPKTASPADEQMHFSDRPAGESAPSSTSDAEAWGWAQWAISDISKKVSEEGKSETAAFTETLYQWHSLVSYVNFMELMMHGTDNSPGSLRAHRIVTTALMTSGEVLTDWVPRVEKEILRAISFDPTKLATALKGLRISFDTWHGEESPERTKALTALVEDAYEG